MAVWPEQIVRLPPWTIGSEGPTLGLAQGHSVLNQRRTLALVSSVHFPICSVFPSLSAPINFLLLAAFAPYCWGTAIRVPAQEETAEEKLFGHQLRPSMQKAPWCKDLRKAAPIPKLPVTRPVITFEFQSKLLSLPCFPVFSIIFSCCSPTRLSRGSSQCLAFGCKYFSEQERA